MYSANAFFISESCALFVFDDAIALMSTATAGDVLKILNVFVGHGLGALGTFFNLGVDRKPKPLYLSVDDLRQKHEDVRVVETTNVRSVRLTTAIWPLLRLGGMDISFLVDPACKPDGTWTWFRYWVKRSDAAEAVEILNRGLPDKVIDARL
jgi:hypothetical protein